MAEFRLNCPGCGAEYILPQDAIPAAGREVECSRCDHVWQAQRPTQTSRPLDLGSFTMGNAGDDNLPPVPLPSASKRLSADVLDILRDEVEHERRLRDAEAQPQTPPKDAILPEIPDNDWPATTVTVPAEAPRKMPRAPADFPAKSPSVIRHLPTRSTTPAPKLHVPPVAVQEPAPRPVTPVPLAQTATRDEYRTGFGLSLLVAACCVGLYIAAPKLAAQDVSFAGQLTQLRAEVDQARLWLADRVTSPAP